MWTAVACYRFSEGSLLPVIKACNTMQHHTFGKRKQASSAKAQASLRTPHIPLHELTRLFGRVINLRTRAYRVIHVIRAGERIGGVGRGILEFDDEDENDDEHKGSRMRWQQGVRLWTTDFQPVVWIYSF